PGGSDEALPVPEENRAIPANQEAFPFSQEAETGQPLHKSLGRNQGREDAQDTPIGADERLGQLHRPHRTIARVVLGEGTYNALTREGLLEDRFPAEVSLAEDAEPAEGLRVPGGIGDAHLQVIAAGHDVVV